MQRLERGLRAALGLVVSAACSGPAVEIAELIPECFEDEACVAEQKCVQGACRAPCEDRSACDDDQVCGRPQGYDVHVCLPEDGDDGTTTGENPSSTATGEPGSGGPSEASTSTSSTVDEADEADEAGEAETGEDIEGCIDRDPGPEIDLFEPCDGTEPVANGDVDAASELPAVSSLVLSADDRDWFTVTTPETNGDQLITLSLSSDQNLAVGISVRPASLAERTEPLRMSRGEKASLYFTTAPSSATRFGFALLDISPQTIARVRVELDIRTIPDPYEPNNDAETATPIAVGDTIEAYMVVPFVSYANREFDDWYRIELNAGPSSLNLLAEPPWGEGDAIVNLLFDDETLATRLELPGSGPQPVPFGVTTAGAYFLQITRAAGSDAFRALATNPRPRHLGVPYTFRIVQSEAP